MAPIHDKVAANQERMNKLARDGVTIDLTPPRIRHLEDYLIPEDEKEAYEESWQDDVVAKILDEVEPQVAKAKLMAGQQGQMPGQLTLVK